MRGLVIKSTGSSYIVRMDDGTDVECRIKGNFRIRGIRSTNPVAVGDYVEVQSDQGQAIYWITEVCERRNYIIRRSTNLSKESHILAANIDQVALIITINHPVTSTTFIDRFLATCEAYRVRAILIFNKIDLLTEAGCAKAAALVRFCDAFDIPVITLTNASGFAQCACEENSVASAAAGLAAAFAGATVPKINVITKRAGGSAYAVMNSKALGADLIFAYTDASVGILEGKYAASVLCDGSADEVKAAAKAYDELQNSIEAAAARGVVDQIIAPEEVRKYLIGAVEMLYSKREALPSRKHASV